MSKLKDLQETTEKTEVPGAETKVADAPSIKDLKPADTAEKKPKVSKRELTEDQLKQYQEILSDGKPHKIKDLLEVFQLPRSNSGRERLRAANRKINASGLAVIEPKFIDGEGKHFMMILNGKS